MVNIRSSHPTANNAFRFNDFSTVLSGGITPPPVLCHFVDATSVTIGRSDFKGTLLAPQAQVTLSGGQFSGGVYAASLNASGWGPIPSRWTCWGGCERGDVRQLCDELRLPGTRVCGATCSWGACAPPAETCNGADDNCDGQVDEGFQCTGSGSRSSRPSAGPRGPGAATETRAAIETSVSPGAAARPMPTARRAPTARQVLLHAAAGERGGLHRRHRVHQRQCVDGVCCDARVRGQPVDTCALPESVGSLRGAPGRERGRALVCAVSVLGGGRLYSSQCALDSECAEGSYCHAGAWRADAGQWGGLRTRTTRAPRAVCGRVCCNSACGGACDACNREGSVGSCRSRLPPWSAGPGRGEQLRCARMFARGRRPAARRMAPEHRRGVRGDSNTCPTVDVCNAAGSCTHAPVIAGTTCGEAQVCNASGQCMAVCSDQRGALGAQSPPERSLRCATQASRRAVGAPGRRDELGEDQGRVGKLREGSMTSATRRVRSRGTVTDSTCGPAVRRSEHEHGTRGCTHAAPDTRCAEPRYGDGEVPVQRHLRARQTKSRHGDELRVQLRQWTVRRVLHRHRDGRGLPSATRTGCGMRGAPRAVLSMSPALRAAPLPGQCEGASGHLVQCGTTMPAPVNGRCDGNDVRRGAAQVYQPACAERQRVYGVQRAVRGHLATPVRERGL